MTFASIRQFVVRYERHLSVAAMAVGFILDNAALKDISGTFESLLLYFYFASAGFFIFAIHLAEARFANARLMRMLRPWFLLALQVILGSWFSAFLVFYSHSASLSASWPFLIILIVLFAGTEIFKSYQDRLAFQNAMYFFCIFSFATSVVPLFLGFIGTEAFLLSGAASVVIFGAFFALLYITGPERLKAASQRVIGAVAVVFLVINGFYFLHLLPPLPLTLKNIGVYHTLVKSGDTYLVSGESASWLSHFLGEEALHITPGSPAYVFSAVYTPIAIQTQLVHRWERFDDATGRWVTMNIVRFPVSGGREEGYRGFSEIGNIAEGTWRVSVETPDGALIGRISFTVHYATGPALVQSAL